MRRLARSLVSSLNMRRLLSFIGLAYWSDLDAAERRVILADLATDRAQDALEETKRMRRQEREQFRKALNIQGVNVARVYRLGVQSDMDVMNYTFPVKRFRFTLTPLQYCAEHACLDG